MAKTLLSTKLFVVRPQTGLVERERLMERIDGIRSRRLTVISAPAGFGKTSLLSTWIERTGFPTAWISLDKGDNEINRFLSYLVAALRRIDPTVGEDILAALTMAVLPPIESLLSPLINDLSSIEEDFLLVLDDYHLITSEEVHGALQFFLEHAPASLHLAITTRVDPPLPLAKLRLRGELLEIRVADLRFSSDESDALFNGRMELGLTPEQLAVLQEKTEGWIAGLQMAALSLEGRSDINSFVRAFDGADRYVLDYLLEEVLSRQPREIERIMLALSILSRFNGPLCEAVTGAEDGAELLEKLERGNLFLISLDNRREWYRYHHLFCDLLQHRLRGSDPDILPELHRRASRWIEANGDLLEALDHARQSEDPEFIRDMVERRWLEILKHAGQEDLEALYAHVPAEMLSTSERLALVKCWSCYFTRDFDQMTVLLDGIERAVPEPRNTEDHDLLGQAAVLRSVMARDQGILAEAIDNGEKALALLPERNSSTAPDYLWFCSRGMILSMLGGAYDISGNIRKGTEMFEESLRFGRLSGDEFCVVTALGNLGKVYVVQGKLDAGLRCADELRENEDTLAASSVPAAPPIPFQIKSRVLYERNDLEGARAAALEAIARVSAFPASQYLEVHRVMMVISLAFGNMAAAWQAVREMETLPLSGPDQKLKAVPQMLRAYLDMLEGRLHEAEVWVAALEEENAGMLTRVRTGSFTFRSMSEILYGKMLAALGRIDDAITILSEVRRDLIDVGLLTMAIETSTILARLLEEAGRREDAMDILEETLRMGAPERFIRSFVSQGVVLAGLLERYKATRWKPQEGVPADYLRSILDAFGLPTSGTADRGSTRASTIDDPDALTSREMEILQLMSIGYSNQKIADKLYLSINTVKTHISNLFDKLGARNRVDALVRAREAGVLE